MTPRIWIIAVLVVLVIANAVVFFTYRVQQQERIDDLRAKRDQLDAQLIDAQNLRRSKERQLAGFQQVDHDVQQVYDERWSTPDKRLVGILVEVRKLATKSALIPKSVSYAYAPGKKAHATDEMEIAFGVAGSYGQVRNLIHLIERSPEFLFIDGIQLSQQNADQLTLTLRLKTLFKATPNATGSEL